MPLQLSLKKRESWPQGLREKCPTPMRLCTVMGLWPFCCRRGPRDGFITTTASVAAPYLFVSRLAWKVLGCYAAFELLLMRVLPGQMQSGRPSPTDHVPVYPRRTASHSPRSDYSRTLACRPWACLRPSGRDPRSSQYICSRPVLAAVL